MTITMIYVLMALTDGPKFGKEIVDWISEITSQDMVIGPGTLYSMLANLERQALIQEVSVVKRVRTYRITEFGSQAYKRALSEYESMLAHAKGVK